MNASITSASLKTCALAQPILLCCTNETKNCKGCKSFSNTNGSCTMTSAWTAKPDHSMTAQFLPLPQLFSFQFPVIKTLTVLSKVIGHLLGYALQCTHIAGESKTWVNVFLYNFDNLRWNTISKNICTNFLKRFSEFFFLHPHETSRNLNCDIHCDCPKIWSNYTLSCTDPTVGTVCFLFRVLQLALVESKMITIDEKLLWHWVKP